MVVALDRQNIRFAPRNVVVTVHDDGDLPIERIRLPWQRVSRRAAGVEPPLVKAGLLEVQQRRDGRDEAYVCKGRVVLQRDLLHATARVLTVGAQAQTARLDACRLCWGGLGTAPQPWSLARVAQLFTRSRVLAESCHVNLATGDVVCRGVRAVRLKGYQCSRGGGRGSESSLLSADELRLLFADGPAVPPRRERTGPLASAPPPLWR